MVLINTITKHTEVTNNMETTLTTMDYLIATQIVQGIQEDIKIVTQILK